MQVKTHSANTLHCKHHRQHFDNLSRYSNQEKASVQPIVKVPRIRIVQMSIRKNLLCCSMIISPCDQSASRFLERYIDNECNWNPFFDLASTGSATFFCINEFYKDKLWRILLLKKQLIDTHDYAWNGIGDQDSFTDPINLCQYKYRIHIEKWQKPFQMQP